MAHFAKLDENNNVLEVHVVSNNVLTASNEEETGIAFLVDWSGGHTNWKQTSYNASFRKNYAGTGYKYDQIKDAFIPPKPFNSWVLNEETCRWDSPIPHPTDGKLYSWDEPSTSWVQVVA